MNYVTDKIKEKTIHDIAILMRKYGFTVEYKVCEKPEGIKILFEVTQDQMNYIVNYCCPIKIGID